MDPLPAEIVHLIVERAQECPLFSTPEDWSARSTTLRSLALVAQRWTATAQHWLNADVWLGSDDHARRFLDSPPMRLSIVRSLRTELVEQTQLHQLLDGATALTSLHVRHNIDQVFHFEQTLRRASLSKLAALVLEAKVQFDGSALPFALRVLDLGSSFIIIPTTVTHLKLASDSLHVLSLPLAVPESSSSARKVLIRSTLLGSAFDLRVLRGLDTGDINIKEVQSALKSCLQLASLELTTRSSGSDAIKTIATTLSYLPHDLPSLFLSFEDGRIPFVDLNNLVHHIARKRVKTLAIAGNEGHPETSRETGWVGYDPEQSFRNQLPEVEMDISHY